ncbi:MAG TPA: ATP-dependent DNA helicase RecG [Oleiagrimonas sp.]|nr:ATP-dependent DNA helicase RecG [Oleiagrimonas sp.]
MSASQAQTDHTRAGQQPVSTLKGVGPALASSLARLGLEQVRDVWFHLPLRYEDRTRVVPVSTLVPGTHVLVEGVVETVDTGFRYRRQLRVALVDDAGGTLLVRFFHFHRGQADALRPGTRLRCFGEARIGQRGAEMVHPQYWHVTPTTPVDARLTPVYPSTEGLGQKRLTRIVDMALECLPDDSVLELIPESLRAPLGLGSLREALLFVHHPPAHADASDLLSGRHPALQRLAFEELLAQHLALRQLRAHMREHQAPSLVRHGALHDRFVAALPFALTAAQRRVTDEITADLASTRPMLRLVQGDVGSGKTVVAALAALAVIESGCQVALMAPTELLAEQHLRNFRAWLEPLGIKVAWLAGKVQGKARKAALADAAGTAGIVIGTHALMQEGVEFANLGLVIVDEQHRFGVHQRLSLRDKGREGDSVPHQLVLTATPIPRTLAMSAYADLDVSSIDEMPPGRMPVQTVVVSNARREEVMQRIRGACAEGRQAYWVCTLIEESEQLEAQAAEVVHAELDEALPGLTVNLVHGRMKAAEKRAAMDAFQCGDIAVLVATTVIEVGVDVPNASLMVIENAERLGLAQLHQLRGRVGRGSVASSCVLLYRPPLSQLARQRLQVMRETGDGFRIAEKDLELRGPGEVLGTRQTGRLEFRVADLARDAHMLPDVQHVGAAMLGSCPLQAERLAQRWIGAAARYADA